MKKIFKNITMVLGVSTIFIAPLAFILAPGQNMEIISRNNSLTMSTPTVKFNDDLATSVAKIYDKNHNTVKNIKDAEYVDMNLKNNGDKNYYVLAYDKGYSGSYHYINNNKNSATIHAHSTSKIFNDLSLESGTYYFINDIGSSSGDAIDFGCFDNFASNIESNINKEIIGKGYQINNLEGYTTWNYIQSWMNDNYNKINNITITEKNGIMNYVLNDFPVIDLSGRSGLFQWYVTTDGYLPTSLDKVAASYKSKSSRVSPTTAGLISLGVLLGIVSIIGTYFGFRLFKLKKEVDQIKK